MLSTKLHLDAALGVTWGEASVLGRTHGSVISMNISALQTAIEAHSANDICILHTQTADMPLSSAIRKLACARPAQVQNRRRTIRVVNYFR